MWEKIAKEMQLPWRAAEAMHWQIGEVEMASRANVPVFHLAGQSTSTSSGSSATPSAINLSTLGQNIDARSNSASPRSPAGSIAPYASTTDQLRNGNTPLEAQGIGPQDYRRNSDASILDDGPRGESNYARNGPSRATAPPTSDSEASSGSQRHYLSPFPRHAEPGGRP